MTYGSRSAMCRRLVGWSMVNGTGFTLGPLGLLVWGIAVFRLLQQRSQDPRILELVILGLITIIGVLLRFAYHDLQKQLAKLHEAKADHAERLATCEENLRIKEQGD